MDILMVKLLMSPFSLACPVCRAPKLAPLETTQSNVGQQTLKVLTWQYKNKQAEQKGSS